MSNQINFSQLKIEQCRHGMMVWPKDDSVIGRSLGLYGEFAEGENRVMAPYVKEGDLVIDVGANLGTTVLPLARAVGSTGQVIAFEPQPLMAQCLLTSLTLNEIFNVRLLSSALGDASGWAKISAPSINQGGNYGAMSLGSEGLQVPVVRLDELELDRCALIKIDVEGYEWPVLQGAKMLLKAHKPVLYLEAKQISGTVAYLDWLMSNGWRCYWHFAFFYNEDNFRKSSTNVFEGVGDMNVLAIPTDQAQPDDLPEIRSSDENWQETYTQYFRQRGLPLR